MRSKTPARGREREHQRGESGVARERERRLVAGVAREREASGGVAREGERAGVSGERVVGGVGRERGERVGRRGRMGNSGKIVAYENLFVESFNDIQFGTEGVLLTLSKN